MTSTTTECCPRFDPEPWDEQTITWSEKKFVTDRVRSFLHIPLNFGSVMKRNVAAIERADAMTPERMVLADECSLWHSDIYVDVTGDVPGVRMTTLSGTFVTKVFEGPYRNVPKWMKQMGAYAQAKGRAVKKLYCYYTTCPKCAKKYGKNYVVLLAQVDGEEPA
jgi:hypothetical protein